MSCQTRGSRPLPVWPSGQSRVEELPFCACCCVELIWRAWTLGGRCIQIYISQIRHTRAKRCLSYTRAKKKSSKKLLSLVLSFGSFVFGFWGCLWFYSESLSARTEKLLWFFLGFCTTTTGFLGGA